MTLRRLDQHASSLLNSVNRMRGNGFICDFTIHAEKKSFVVHRTVITACSQYFEAMFSSDTKEVKEGAVHMKDVTAEAVSQCIDFIYTGQALLTVEMVEDTLYAAEMMLLEPLKNLCFEYLSENIEAENCIHLKCLAELYDYPQLVTKVDSFIKFNLTSVMRTSEYLCLDVDQVLHHLKNSSASSEVAWDAAVSWTKHNLDNREKYFHSLLTSLKLNEFSFQFLLRALCEESLIQNALECRSLIGEYLFANINRVEGNLSVQTCFPIKGLLETIKLPNKEEIQKVLSFFILHHFEEIVQQKAFVEMQKEFVLEILRSPSANCSSETVKWDAIVKWTDYDRQHRKREFPKLLSCLNFQKLQFHFIQETMRNHALVRKSHDCKDIIINSMCTAGASTSKNISPCIALCDGSSAKLHLLDVSRAQWDATASTEIPGGLVDAVICVRHKLYALVGTFLLEKQPDGFEQQVWQNKASLKHTPDRESMKTVVCKNCIYVLEQSRLSCYDMIRDSWQEDLPWHPFEEEFCVAASGSSLFAVGCTHGGFGTMEYNLRRQSWVPLPLMFLPRRGASACVLYDRLYVIGGSHGWVTEGGTGAVNSVDCYSRSTQSWTSCANMSVRRLYPSSCVVNDTIYVIGGNGNNANGTSDLDNFIEVYDEVENLWKVLPKGKKCNFEPIYDQFLTVAVYYR